MVWSAAELLGETMHYMTEKCSIAVLPALHHMMAMLYKVQDDVFPH